MKTKKVSLDLATFLRSLILMRAEWSGVEGQI